MAANFHIENDLNSSCLRLQGALDIYHVQQAKKALQNALKGAPRSIAIDASGLDKLDTVGALLLRQFQEKKHIAIEHIKSEHKALFEMVAKMDIAAPKTTRRIAAWKQLLISVGKNTIQLYVGIIELLTFFGHTCVVFFKTMLSPKHLRFADIMHHIEEIGIEAIPIISLMAFMIAVVIAYQAVAQLRQLGAENLTINLVAISVLREMGVLLTAIMVAGRSGSAFTAEIGVMKVREEVDALQVIGINPFEVLVLPRLIALVIALPLLTFVADMMGLLGGGVMSIFLIDIPFGAYMERVHTVATTQVFMIGMIKAPVFAFLIAIVGCMHGMRVSGSAESVGKETTASVVKSIFLVLMADAIFSIIFEKIGI